MERRQYQSKVKLKICVRYVPNIESLVIIFTQFLNLFLKILTVYYTIYIFIILDFISSELQLWISKENNIGWAFILDPTIIQGVCVFLHRILMPGSLIVKLLVGFTSASILQLLINVLNAKNICSFSSLQLTPLFHSETSNFQVHSGINSKYFLLDWRRYYAIGYSKYKCDDT